MTDSNSTENKVLKSSGPKPSHLCINFVALVNLSYVLYIRYVYWEGKKKKRLWWKPSFNLEFNKNWLSITEHKQSCSINLSALFVQEWKKTLSAETDDRCWLKDKYYLYFCTRFLLMHILSCMDIQSTKQLLCISQRPYNILLLHGNLFYTVHCSIKEGERKCSRKCLNYVWNTLSHWSTETEQPNLYKLSCPETHWCFADHWGISVISAVRAFFTKLVTLDNTATN